MFTNFKYLNYNNIKKNFTLINIFYALTSLIIVTLIKHFYFNDLANLVFLFSTLGLGGLFNAIVSIIYNANYLQGENSPVEPEDFKDNNKGFLVLTQIDSPESRTSKTETVIFTPQESTASTNANSSHSSDSISISDSKAKATEWLKQVDEPDQEQDIEDTRTNMDETHKGELETSMAKLPTIKSMYENNKWQAEHIEKLLNTDNYSDRERKDLLKDLEYVKSKSEYYSELYDYHVEKVAELEEKIMSED